MTEFAGTESDYPNPRLLAAWVDDQLDVAARARLDAWLLDHPDVAEELQDHLRLKQDWNRLPLPHPSAAEWQRVLTNVQQSVLAATPRRRPRTWWWRGIIGGAAGLLLALGLWSRPTVDNSAEPPIAVATDADVDILSIAEADHRAVVVGHLPLREPIVLVSTGDVQVENIEPDSDGMVPRVLWEEGPTAPMVVAPLASSAPPRTP